LGREAARPCVSKEAKLAKIVSLIVKDFCARPLKDLSIFAGFVRRAVASRWVECLACGASLVNRSVQNRFGFGCIIAPKTPKLMEFFLKIIEIYLLS